MLKPYYYTYAATSNHSSFKVPSWDYQFTTGWADANYTKSGFSNVTYQVKTIDKQILSVDNPELSGEANVYDRLVSFSFDPPKSAHWIGSGQDYFYIENTGAINLVAYDNQRPYEVHWNIAATNSSYSSGNFQGGYAELTGEIIPSENVLLVYNQLSPISIDLKDYYTGARTGLKGLNILGISCDSGQFTEVTTTGDYVRNIREPIWNYIRATPKPIKYCILMYGIPTYMTGDISGEGSGKIWSDWYSNVAHETRPGDQTLNLGLSGCVAYDLMHGMYHTSGYSRHPNFETPTELYHSYTADNFGELGFWSGKYCNSISKPFYRKFTLGQDFNTTFLVTHLFADSAADVSGYIHKITGQGIVDGIYLRGNGLNTGSLISSATRTYSENWFLNVAKLTSGYYSGLNDMIVYQSNADWEARTVYGVNTPQITGYDINAFISWGIHTNDSNAGPNGQIQNTTNTPLNGDNNWFWTAHIESYGAQNRAVSYGPSSYKSYWFSAPWKQFASNAYGGSDYSNVPVGWFGHVQEPSQLAFYTCEPAMRMWLSGREPWIHCVYGASMQGGLFGKLGGISIGDPFVTCF